MIYDNWKIKKWDTPVSDSKNLGMVSLVDSASSNKLEILLNNGASEIIITFDNYPAYRNILEEYRVKLWNHLDKTSQRCGWTFEVLDSDWVQELQKTESLIEFHNPGLRHFVISTDDDVIEVLSNREPKIELKV